MAAAGQLCWLYATGNNNGRRWYYWRHHQLGNSEMLASYCIPTNNALPVLLFCCMWLAKFSANKANHVVCRFKSQLISSCCCNRWSTLMMLTTAMMVCMDSRRHNYTLGLGGKSPSLFYLFVMDNATTLYVCVWVQLMPWLIFLDSLDVNIFVGTHLIFKMLGHVWKQTFVGGFQSNASLIAQQTKTHRHFTFTLAFYWL